MVTTISLGRRRRLTVVWTRLGDLYAKVWRTQSCGDWLGDDPPDTGVREPRRPRAPQLGGGADAGLRTGS